VYIDDQYQHVSGGGNAFTADINGLSPSANDSQVALTAGLRSRF
jgi:GBP family porin